MNLALTRHRFLKDAVATSGPQRILTMLYDRLVLDIDRARAAQCDGDRSEATMHLYHAQDIVALLASTLDVTAWSGGKGLMDLYLYLLRELIGCSIAGDPDRTARLDEVVKPLRDAWHEAAITVEPEAAPEPEAALIPLVPTQHTRVSADGETAASGELGIG